MPIGGCDKCASSRGAPSAGDRSNCNAADQSYSSVDDTDAATGSPSSVPTPSSDASDASFGRGARVRGDGVMATYEVQGRRMERDARQRVIRDDVRLTSADSRTLAFDAAEKMVADGFKTWIFRIDRGAGGKLTSCSTECLSKRRARARRTCHEFLLVVEPSDSGRRGTIPGPRRPEPQEGSAGPMSTQRMNGVEAT